jgi:GH24 family phage-related lysozyme (muramidase)
VRNDTKLYAYKDSEGIPTIGWGTVDQPSGKQTKMGDVITKAMADRWLEYKYLQFKKQIVPKLPTWNSMSDEQKAAILSYTYNAGANWPENDKNAYKALVEGDFHKAAGFWTQGWSGQPELLKRRKEEADMIRSGPVNPLMGIVGTAYKKPVKRQQGGIVLFSGHGDISSGQTGTAGEKEAAKKVAKRIQDKTSGQIKYIPSQASWAFNGPQDSKNEPANSNWNLGKAEAAKGNVPIELHFNSPGGATGLISSGLKRSLSPAETALQNSFGVIGGDYGSPKYGVTMLELQGGAMRVNVDALADKFINAVSGKLGKVNEQPVSGGQPGGSNSAPPDMENSPKSLLATIPGMGNLTGSLTSMFGMAGNIGTMMKGFMEGFTKASGIDLQSITSGITSMAGSLFGQPAQAATSPPAG